MLTTDFSAPTSALYLTASNPPTSGKGSIAPALTPSPDPMPSGTLAGRSQDLPTLGPLCDHAEPTVLKDLNSA